MDTPPHIPSLLICSGNRPIYVLARAAEVQFLTAGNVEFKPDDRDE